MGENGIEDKSRTGLGRGRNRWQIDTFEYFYYTGKADDVFGSVVAQVAAAVLPQHHTGIP
jgi:hypothetical protein